MHLRSISLFLSLGLLLAGAISPASAKDKESDPYIVVLKDGVDSEKKAEDHEKEGKSQADKVFKYVIQGYSSELTSDQKASLLQDPDVAYIEPDLPISIAAQTVPTGIDRMEAERNAVAKIDGIDERANVDVAVIDTGIDLDHPDLNVIASTNCSVTGLLGTSCTGTGDDDNGHGSHVAGSIAALDNTIGVVGVAPGARLHAVKVLDALGNGTGSTIIAGMDWVAARSTTIEVVNMSVGGSGYSQAERDSLQNLVNKGVVVVVAAGNETRDVYGPDGVFGNSDDTRPASYPGAMTISAIADFDGKPGGLGSGSFAFSSCTENKDDSMACFSNYSRSGAGSPVSSSGGKIDLALPGTNIYSTYMNGGYTNMSGTSMASPHAAGLVATYVVANGRASNAAGVYAIRQALVNAGQDMRGPNGLTTVDDPDTLNERLGWSLGWPGSGGTTPNTPPVANFTSSCAGLTCNFTDTSTDSDGTIASRSWAFGDGGTSTAQNPSRTYAASGTYDVTLTVTDNGGATHSTTKSVTVSAGNTSPTANFTFSCPNLACNFTDTSTDSDGTVTAWSWNFGNGQTSTVRHPSHTYASAGTYNVTLTVTDNGGATNSITKSVTVTTGDPDPGAFTLTNGVAKSDTNGAVGTWKYYKIQVPAGRSQLVVEQRSTKSCGLLGCNPDLDLYVRQGARPTATLYNCRQQTNGINETCTISAPAADWWYVGVYVYGGGAAATYTVKATY